MKRALTFIFCTLFGGADLGAQSMGSFQIVASFTVVKDWCQVAVNKGVTITCLVPERSELHGFQLSAKDAQKLDRASLIVGMSPDLEPWLATWVKANHREARMTWLSPTSIVSSAENDPHRWTDPQEVVKLLQTLHQALAAASTPGVSPDACERQLAEVRAVDRELAELFRTLPAGSRSLITQHPNLGWFARRYGLNIVGTILASGSAEAADPSARHYSNLLAVIRSQRVRVIVTDEGQNEILAQRLAKDAGIPAPVGLSFEYLEPTGQDGNTWASMMRRNSQRLHAALIAP